MTLFLIFLAATAALSRVRDGFRAFAVSTDRDTQSRRPRNLSQSAVQQKADRQGGVQSFHGVHS